MATTTVYVEWPGHPMRLTYEDGEMALDVADAMFQAMESAGVQGNVRIEDADGLGFPYMGPTAKLSERLARGCGCACCSGGFCGGCGHAGCGRR